MLDAIRDLFRHQQWADNALLRAISDHESARTDDELRKLLHHMVATHRFFVIHCQGLPDVREQEVNCPGELSGVADRLRETRSLTAAWLDELAEDDLQRTVELPFFPGRQILVRDALFQVLLHSQGHRSQCATRLRLLGGKAPTLDYILWSSQRAESATST